MDWNSLESVESYLTKLRLKQNYCVSSFIPQRTAHSWWDSAFAKKEMTVQWTDAGEEDSKTIPREPDECSAGCGTGCWIPKDA